jgi:hypothetical protein
MDGEKKDAAAVSLGRRGGRAKVPKGFSLMDPDRRAEIAKKAAAARWGKKATGRSTKRLPTKAGRPLHKKLPRKSAEESSA